MGGFGAGCGPWYDGATVLGLDAAIHGVVGGWSRVFGTSLDVMCMAIRNNQQVNDAGAQPGSHFGGYSPTMPMARGAVGVNPAAPKFSRPQGQRFAAPENTYGSYDDDYSSYGYDQQAYYGYQQPGGPGYPGGPGGYGYPPQDPQPPKKSGKGLTILAVILLIVGLALLIGAGVIWFTSQQAYQVGIDEYEQVADANVTEDAVTGRPVVDFAALKLLNPEIVGWIQIPGTPINYPVCQHSDNDYYLEHTFLDQYNLAGTVFMDYRSNANLSGWNTVMYGHHLKNGEMFAKVADYSDQAQFNTIQNIYYVSEDGQVHVLVPLCCMVVNGYDVDSIQFDFADQASFEAYVQSLIDRSSARSATATAAGVSHIYMLSTCSYANENDRTILVCTDLSAGNGPVIDATQNMADIQAAADQAAGIDNGAPVEG